MSCCNTSFGGFRILLEKKIRSALNLNWGFGAGAGKCAGVVGGGGVIGHHLGLFCYDDCANLKGYIVGYNIEDLSETIVKQYILHYKIIRNP